jgi:hypothetical protein
MTLWVPPKVEAEMAEQARVQSRARLRALMDFDDPVCKQWEPELRKLDPYIRLGRAKPMAYAPDLGVKAGYYHFLRDNPGAPPTVAPITGPNDEWIEPDGGVLRKLQENDLQRPGVMRERLAREQRREQEQEREQERDLEEWTAEAVERWNAGNRAFVSMDRSTPWTQSARAKRTG